MQSEGDWVFKAVLEFFIQTLIKLQMYIIMDKIFISFGDETRHILIENAS